MTTGEDVQVPCRFLSVKSVKDVARLEKRGLGFPQFSSIRCSFVTVSVRNWWAAAHTHTDESRALTTVRNRRCQTGQWAIGLQLSSFPERDLMVIHIQKRKAAAVLADGSIKSLILVKFFKRKGNLCSSPPCAFLGTFLPFVKSNFWADPSFWAHTPPHHQTFSVKCVALLVSFFTATFFNLSKF